MRNDDGEELCKDCPDGVMLDFNEAFPWFPPNQDEGQLAESIAWMHKMNTKYQEIDEARRSRGGKQIWTYTGDQ